MMLLHVLQTCLKEEMSVMEIWDAYYEEETLAGDDLYGNRTGKPETGMKEGHQND